MTADKLISMLDLKPLAVEGGHYRETWRSRDSAPLPRFTSAKSFGSAIYYLLCSAADSFSALHRLPTDEIYHFYLGDPVEMLLLGPGNDSRRVVLGHDIAAGQHVQYVVPAGVWQGSRLIAGGAYALLGTTMAPAFDCGDYEAGVRGDLVRQFPACANLIQALTR